MANEPESVLNIEIVVFIIASVSLLSEEAVQRRSKTNKEAFINVWSRNFTPCTSLLLYSK